MNFWETVDLELGTILHWQIGTLRLWALKSEQELCLYHEECDDEAAPLVCAGKEPLPDDVKWHRWALKGHTNKMVLKPVMPDKPVVVRPETDLNFFQGTEGICYARIPFWIAVMIGEQIPDQLVYEVPTKTLSNTWFGPDTTRGRLCYGMSTSARRSLEGVETANHRAICPVKLKNASEDVFEFQRLCIHTAYLNIYEHENALWTSRLELTFRGEGRQDMIAYNEEFFDDHQKPELISERRERPESKFFKRSLESLKSLTNIF